MLRTERQPSGTVQTGCSRVDGHGQESGTREGCNPRVWGRVGAKMWSGVGGNRTRDMYIQYILYLHTKSGLSDGEASGLPRLLAVHRDGYGRVGQGRVRSSQVRSVRVSTPCLPNASAARYDGPVKYRRRFVCVCASVCECAWAWACVRVCVRGARYHPTLQDGAE